MKGKLTRVSLFRALEKVANRLSEHRNIKAPNYKYPIASATFTAFGAFYFHHPSLRSHEMTLEQKVYQSNFKKLFHRDPIFCSQTMRNILDPISEQNFIPIFDDVFSKLDRSGVLRNLIFSDQMGLLLSGDGVDYFASEEISCGNCSYAEHKQENGEVRTVYTHKMFNVGIVHPSENLFFPLAPEFITPQDGHQKQDCEKNAAKRWLCSFRRRHKTLRATFQVDALHCNHEFLTDVKKYRFHFIATCKKGSNKTLYDWIETARSGGDIHILEEIRIIKGKKVLFRYEYLNNVPIRDTEDALRVNFLSVREINQKSGKQSQPFEYVTDFSIKETNVKQLALAGRKRWKVENEGHNILKNQGYYFDRNYGHGKKHLSAVIAMLILFSFLVHAILRYIGQDGIALLFKKCHARKVCIELLRYMTQDRVSNRMGRTLSIFNEVPAKILMLKRVAGG
jgi:hypothetical protein